MAEKQKLITSDSDVDRGGSGRPLNEGEKCGILIMRSKGMSISEIAKVLGRSEGTISGLLRKAREWAESTGVDYDFKDDLKIRAIDAVKFGLDCDLDPYKRGNLGVNVLKGVGVFAADGAQISINNMIASVPPDWQKRYITVEGEEL